jgi:hypothetical protein
MRSIKDSIIFWNPMDEGLEPIVIRPLKPWGINKNFPYRSSWGGCNKEIFDCEDFEKRKALIFINAMHFIISSGIDPIDVHNALLGLEEYYDGCSDEIV